MRGRLLPSIACVLLITATVRSQEEPGRAWADEPVMPAETMFVPRSGDCIVTPAEIALDNLSLFGGLEASRQPQDLGVNANFGGNLSANVGIPLWESIGFQAGVGVNLSKAGVKVLRVAEGTRSRTQFFGTVGFFTRHDDWYGGIAYDHQESSYYTRITAGQFRGEAGYYIGGGHTVGVLGTAAAVGDEATLLGATFNLRPISQASLFWNHVWETGAETRLWLGVAGQHGTDIITLPDTTRTDLVAVFGLQVFVPLDEHFALFGQGNFVTPSDTGTLDAYLGFAYFFGGSRESRTNRFAPVLPVANNPTFALDLRRP